MIVSFSFVTVLFNCSMFNLAISADAAAAAACCCRCRSRRCCWCCYCNCCRRRRSRAAQHSPTDLDHHRMELVAEYVPDRVPAGARHRAQTCSREDPAVWQQSIIYVCLFCLSCMVFLLRVLCLVVFNVCSYSTNPHHIGMAFVTKYFVVSGVPGT